jgi:hypothetical protein
MTDVPAPELRLRPIRFGDERELLRIHRTPAVRRWWGDPAPGFPWADEPEAIRVVIEADGAVVGMVQFTEQLEPRYRHASIDLFLDPSRDGLPIELLADEATDSGAQAGTTAIAAKSIELETGAERQ